MQGVDSVHLKIKIASVNSETRCISTISRKNKGMWSVYLKRIRIDTVGPLLRSRRGKKLKGFKAWVKGVFLE